MLLLLETFDVAAADRPRFVERTEREVWPALPAGASPAGLFRVVLGGPDRLVSVLRLETAAAWRPPDADPRAPWIRGYESVALQPLARRRPPERAPETDPGLYTLRTFRVQPKNEKEFVRLVEEGTMPWFESMGIRVVDIWKSVLTEDPLIFLPARYDDLAHWERTFGAGPEPSDPAKKAEWKRALELLAARNALADHTGIRVLQPLSARRP